MEIFSNFMRGLLTAMKVTGASHLYRHPYRNSSEGLRADWGNIGRDIDSVMGKLKTGESNE